MNDLTKRTWAEIRLPAIRHNYHAIGLIMTGTDAIGDAVISVAILAAIAVYRVTGVDIENWVSIVISLFIIKTGVEMLRECVSKLLGRRADPELQKVQEFSFPV